MDDRQALTVRFPRHVLNQARELRQKDESLNDLIVTATAREVALRAGLSAHAQIVALRERIKERTGLHPDPVPLLRSLRQGVERRE